MTLSDIFGAVKAAKAALISGVSVAAICLPLAYCTGSRSATARCDAARAIANTKAEENDAHAKDNAAVDRVQDALAIQKHEEELTDAISSVPDDKPDRVRVALGCQRLRSQGTVEADLPAVCRP